jgi:hypothetical protein
MSRPRSRQSIHSRTGALGAMIANTARSPHSGQLADGRYTHLPVSGDWAPRWLMHDGLPGTARSSPTVASGATAPLERADWNRSTGPAALRRTSPSPRGAGPARSTWAMYRRRVSAHVFRRRFVLRRRGESCALWI